MPTRSAGLLLHRVVEGRREVLLVHPGGPFWARRNEGAWSIPKGEYTDEEEPLAAARREFAEELGIAPPAGEAVELGEIRQSSGKRVRAFALPGDLDVDLIRSNTCEIVWPPRSGRRLEIPEVDEARWFELHEASRHLLEAQRPLLARLEQSLADGPEMVGNRTDGAAEEG